MGIKWLDQLDHDKGRKTYKVVFPASTDAIQVANFFASISGALSDSFYGLLGSYTIGIEVHAGPRGIEHFLLIPWQRQETIVAMLRSNIPGVEIVPAERVSKSWTRIVELGEKSAEHTFHVPDPARLSTSILQMLGSLTDSESVMIQWVITSDRPQRKPQEGSDKDALADTRSKLGTRGMRAVLRLAASAKTERHATDLIRRIQQVVDSTATPHNRLVTAWATQRDLQRRVNEASYPLIPGLHLSLPELVGLVGIPLNGPGIAGLSQNTSRSIPPTDRIGSTGRILGFSDHHGRTMRPIAISHDDALRHTWIIGASGQGKTTAMAEYALQDMASGHGVILIEASGDLYRTVLDRVPRNRLNDVITLDVTDQAFPLGFNILRQGTSDVVIEELCRLFEKMSDSSSLFNRRVMYHALKTLALDEKATFADIEALISPMAHQVDWHEVMKKKADVDPTLKGFWQDYDAMGKVKAQQFVQPTLNRVWELLSRDVVKHIVGQPVSSFQMDDVVRDNKILLVNLFGLPPETSNIMGKLLVSSIDRSIRRVRAERPNFLYMDEVHNFVGTSTDPRVMFAEARKFGLGLVVAHQYLKQLTPNLTAAIMANASTKIAFRTEAEDARQVATQFAGTITPDDLLNIRKHHAVVRLEGTDGSVNTVTITGPPPSPSNRTAGEIISRNRAQYGRPLHDVEQSFRDRYAVERPARRKPPTADVGWEDLQ